MSTVDAISEATIQVLLSDGVDRLTTTRVAERAGVSVGTLYQYYPNKQSLLFAVLAAHLDRVASAVETACEQTRGRALDAMINAVVNAYIDAKLERADISLALYHIAADVDGPALVRRLGQRFRKALGGLLQTASELETPLDAFTIDMLSAAITGTTRNVLEAGASPAMIRNLRQHLVVLSHAYVIATAAGAAGEPVGRKRS